ncbi:MAG: response regulator transcription factor [Chloroflexi bacterium]|nr:response regulator transcription factor [Chloroflexota bacterium]
MAGKRILVVDDEAKIVDILRLYLERDGYEVMTASDGQKALEAAAQRQPDLVVLDLNLPDMDGLEVCRVLRRTSNLPVIMLTARDEDVDKLIGLELGADDYITKPFSPREVVARVRTVLRRASGEPEARVVVGDLAIDPLRHQAQWGDKTLVLSPTEFKLLLVLARNQGLVYTRMQLLDLVQGETYEGYERTIDAHIKNLRQKMALTAGKRGPSIVTVRGVGYKLEEGGHA